MRKDYYQILEVDKDSSFEDIRISYKKLAKKYHPDISNEENAQEKFKEINEAYDVLSDEEKKHQYDSFYNRSYNPYYKQYSYNQTAYNQYDYKRTYQNSKFIHIINFIMFFYSSYKKSKTWALSKPYLIKLAVDIFWFVLLVILGIIFLTILFGIILLLFMLVIPVLIFFIACYILFRMISFIFRRTNGK